MRPTDSEMVEVRNRDRARSSPLPKVGERGAILVEYGMVLVAVALLSFALVQLIGGHVVEMFRGVLPGFR